MTSEKKIWMALVAVAIIAIGGILISLHAAGSATLPGSLANSTNFSQLGATEGKFGPGCGDSSTYNACTGTTINSSGVTITTSLWSIGGIHYASVEQSLAATSSVPCSIANPFGAATSTVLSYWHQVTANGLSSQSVDVSTSSTAYASSSPAFVKNHSTGSGQDTVVWTPGFSSSTNPSTGILSYGLFSSDGSSPFILGPSLDLNMKISTATPGTFSTYYTGTCGATMMRNS